MVVENIVPPMPSELIIPLAGHLATRGDMSSVVVVAAGTVGSLVGTLH